VPHDLYYLLPILTVMANQCPARREQIGASPTGGKIGVHKGYEVPLDISYLLHVLPRSGKTCKTLSLHTSKTPSRRRLGSNDFNRDY